MFGDFDPAAGALALVQFSYTLGWGTVVGVLMSELMPAKVRGAGTAVAGAVGGLANTGIATLFTPLSATVGLDVIFYSMGVGILLLSLICLFWLPQTEGYALEDIEQYFSGETRATSSNDAEVVSLREEVIALRKQVVDLQEQLAQAQAQNSAIKEVVDVRV